MFYFAQNTLDTVDIGTTLFEENPGQTLLSTSNHICKQLFDGILAKEKEKKRCQVMTEFMLYPLNPKNDQYIISP